MPRRALRSRSYRKVKRRIPSGQSKVIYERRRPSKAACAVCGTKLQGVPAERPGKLKRIPKSKKAPTRIYGGILCPRCLKEKIKNEKVFSFESKIQK